MVPQSTDVQDRWLEPLTAAVDCEAALYGYLRGLKNHDPERYRKVPPRSEIHTRSVRKECADATDVLELLIESMTATAVCQSAWRSCLE